MTLNVKYFPGTQHKHSRYPCLCRDPDRPGNRFGAWFKGQQPPPKVNFLEEEVEGRWVTGYEFYADRYGDPQKFPYRGSGNLEDPPNHLYDSNLIY
jgi:hypothetical protein